MRSITYSDNGTASLLPYCLPRSLDEHGDPEDQGRYCVAYSRDGWFLLDANNWTILRWSADEGDIRAAQVAVGGLGHWFNGLILNNEPHHCDFCDADAVVYHDDGRHGLTMFTEPPAPRIETCDRHDRLFHETAWEGSAAQRER